MQTRSVPVYYDNELVPDLKVTIQRMSDTDMWTISFTDLFTLESKVSSSVPDYKGIRTTQVFDDHVELYSA